MCIIIRASFLKWKGFAATGALFVASECAVEKARGKSDIYNAVVGGCVAGAALSAGGRRESERRGAIDVLGTDFIWRWCTGNGVWVWRFCIVQRGNWDDDTQWLSVKVWRGQRLGGRRGEEEEIVVMAVRGRALFWMEMQMHL